MFYYSYYTQHITTFFTQPSVTTKSSKQCDYSTNLCQNVTNNFLKGCLYLNLHLRQSLTGVLSNHLGERTRSEQFVIHSHNSQIVVGSTLVSNGLTAAIRKRLGDNYGERSRDRRPHSELQGSCVRMELFSTYSYLVVMYS